MADVLDLGTGSGVCAVFAARHARRVVAVDINRAAVRCADLNAQLNQLDASHRVPAWRPVRAGGRRSASTSSSSIRRSSPGAPANARDCAWRSRRCGRRVSPPASTAHLAPRGRAYLLLSTFGDACALFVEELARRGYRDVGARGAALRQRARHHSRSARHPPRGAGA